MIAFGQEACGRRRSLPTSTPVRRRALAGPGSTSRERAWACRYHRRSPWYVVHIDPVAGGQGRGQSGAAVVTSAAKQRVSGLKMAQGSGHTAAQPAAAVGRDHGIDIRQLVEDLKGDDALFPAITAGSLKAWMKRPSIPSKRRVSKDLEPFGERHRDGVDAAQPFRMAARSLWLGRVLRRNQLYTSGPRRRVHQATPCAMLPALAVQTPCASFLGGIRQTDGIGCAVEFL